MPKIPSSTPSYPAQCDQSRVAAYRLLLRMLFASGPDIDLPSACQNEVTPDGQNQAATFVMAQPTTSVKEQ